MNRLQLQMIHEEKWDPFQGLVKDFYKTNQSFKAIQCAFCNHPNISFVPKRQREACRKSHYSLQALQRLFLSIMMHLNVAKTVEECVSELRSMNKTSLHSQLSYRAKAMETSAVNLRLKTDYNIIEASTVLTKFRIL